ncbi:unnamed protein product [Aspergillus oryzae]|uniref:Unnamed protein product n=1 Tax=Aspergillus oryzae TaxID=5062 RepID=A0AAN4Y7P9_ASPOZ|nr:unnamed protein product [Aspergillus oryzae]GMF86128.1 unnamed protein product [Aspergillus oryzae]GMG22469.1 unnamed protein product [Aspergillus oryzae]
MDETEGRQMNSNNVCTSNIYLVSDNDTSVVRGCSIFQLHPITRALWVPILPTELHDVHQRWIGFTHSEWRAGGLLSPQASRRMGKKAPDMTCMKAVRNSRIVVRLRLNTFNPSISLGKP